MSRIVVLGSGAAGIAAARTMSPFHDVTVVEVASSLGGIGGRLSCKAGTDCSVCTACSLPDLLEEVHADPRTEVLEGTTVESAARQANGSWRLQLAGGNPGEVVADAVVVATGLDVASGEALAEYGAGRIPGVVTALELDEALRHDSQGTASPLPIGEDAEGVAFIQCVCSRDVDELPYCSRVCCAYTARLAMEVRAKRPGASVTVFYMDLQLEDEVSSRQIALAMADEGIDYVRSRPASVQAIPGGGLEVLYEDTLGGDIATRRFDTVVLSTGLVPSEGTGRAVELFGLETGPHGFIESGGDDPGRTTVEGVFAAGGATGPADLVEASTSGVAAACSVLGDLPPAWERRPRLLLLGEREVLLDAPAAAERMGASLSLVEGAPGRRLHRLEGEPLAFTAHLDGGADAIEADVVVVAPGRPGRDPDLALPGAIAYEEAWGSIESGTMRGRVVVVMGRDREALLLAGALTGAEDASVDVVYREMAVADGGMQELQQELSAGGVRFFRYAEGSLRLTRSEGGASVVSLVDELLPDGGMIKLEADLVLAPPAATRGPDQAWPIATHAPGGVPSERRLNVLPVTTPRRGVYTGTPGTLTGDAVQLGCAAAVATALSDLARGFMPCEEVAHVDKEACAACLNCLRVCPHDAIVFDEEDRAARILTRACQACGLCTSTCPALAIEMVPGEGGDAVG